MQKLVVQDGAKDVATVQMCLTTTTVVLFAATNTNFGMPATNRVEWQHPESQHLLALRSIPD